MPNIRDNAVSSLIALNQVNKTFHEYAIIFNDFERRSKAGMNDDVSCYRLIIGMASVSLKTHAMSPR
jgi:hypothetical protein